MTNDIINPAVINPAIGTALEQASQKAKAAVNARVATIEADLATEIGRAVELAVREAVGMMPASLAEAVERQIARVDDLVAIALEKAFAEPATSTIPEPQPDPIITAIPETMEPETIRETVAAQAVAVESPAFISDDAVLLDQDDHEASDEQPIIVCTPDGLHTMNVRTGGQWVGKRDYRPCKAPAAGERYWIKDGKVWREARYTPLAEESGR